MITKVALNAKIPEIERRKAKERYDYKELDAIIEVLSIGSIVEFQYDDDWSSVESLHNSLYYHLKIKYGGTVKVVRRKKHIYIEKSSL